MVSNDVLKAIKERRSPIHYGSTPIPDDKLGTILEAGQWAPSWVNSQPWNFIVVTDPGTKKKLNEAAATILGRGIEEAPVIVAVTADTKKDPHHFVEDCAAATQNMALAAHSLGYGSYWVGVYDIRNEKGSSEEKIKDLLKVPATHRVISLLPIGEASDIPTKTRKPLKEIVSRDQFGKSWT